MRIAVLGATGMAGAAIVSEAIARGHQVIAASRQPSATPSDDGRLEARAVDVDDPEHVPVAWTTIAQASLDQYDACQEHPCTGWVYLSPPAVFEPGERSGSYLRGTTTLVTDANGVSRITAPDLAIAVLDELENPGAERHFTVAQRPAS